MRLRTLMKYGCTTFKVPDCKTNKSYDKMWVKYVLYRWGLPMDVIDYIFRDMYVHLDRDTLVYVIGKKGPYFCSYTCK